MNIPWRWSASTAAITQAEAHGLLGENILGSGFSFSIRIVRGAGAFVCGEETALLASIEGGLGEPRPKPPYPAEAGLWGQPTVINNVKTWATVPVILARGADVVRGPGQRRTTPARWSSRWSARSPTPAWWRCRWA